jgi:hypothetical protein
MFWVADVAVANASAAGLAWSTPAGPGGGVGVETPGGGVGTPGAGDGVATMDEPIGVVLTAPPHAVSAATMSNAEVRT